MTIRTILVDDEKLAIQGLQLRLQPFEDVEIIDTCANGREAIRKIKTEKPDLVFLDIQMPGFDGFSVVQGMMEVEPPLFVFVTAFTQHALKAFEAQAVDYLLKPVEEDRLAATIERVRQRLAEKQGAQATRGVIELAVGRHHDGHARRGHLREMHAFQQRRHVRLQRSGGCRLGRRRVRRQRGTLRQVQGIAGATQARKQCAQRTREFPTGGCQQSARCVLERSGVRVQRSGARGGRFGYLVMQ